MYQQLADCIRYLFGIYRCAKDLLGHFYHYRFFIDGVGRFLRLVLSAHLMLVQNTTLDQPSPITYLFVVHLLY